MDDFVNFAALSSIFGELIKNLFMGSQRGCNNYRKRDNSVRKSSSWIDLTKEI